jgi:hypothetical protein
MLALPGCPCNAVNLTATLLDTRRPLAETVHALLEIAAVK